ncbi:hypothetical protein Tco_1353056 [Tanacetum coccineum]
MSDHECCYNRNDRARLVLIVVLMEKYWWIEIRARIGPVWGCDRLISRAKVIVNQVIAALVILISSESSEESVVSHVLRVILFGAIDEKSLMTTATAIPAIIPVIPKVPAEIPIVHADPFVCTETAKSMYAEQRPERHESLVVHDVMVLRWRDRVTSRPSSPSGLSFYDTFAPSSEFPIAPVVDPHGICRRPTILFRPGKAIPFGQPYHTHLNGLRKLLIVRKRVEPFPARRLA